MHRFAPVLVGNTDDCGVAHGRVSGEATLNLRGGNAHAAALDHVLESPGVMKVTVLVDMPEVAGMKPPAVQRLGGRGFVVEVAQHHVGTCDHDLALLA